MNSRQRQDLDRHITGGYGADQERPHTRSRMDGGDALDREDYTKVGRGDPDSLARRAEQDAMAAVTLASLKAAVAWFDKWLERRPPETPIPDWYNEAQTVIQKARGQ